MQVPDAERLKWGYLTSDVFLSRHSLAAYYLRNCSNILEVGAFKTPITDFLTGRHNSVTVLDPEIPPLEKDTLNGFPCSVRHIPLEIEKYRLRGDEDGFLFLGIWGVDTEELVAKMRGCRVIVLEITAAWANCPKQLVEILRSDLFFVKERIAMELAHNDFKGSNPGPSSVRHVYLLGNRQLEPALDPGQKELERWITVIEDETSALLASLFPPPKRTWRRHIPQPVKKIYRRLFRG